MIRFQFVLYILFITLASCQGDTTVQNPVATGNQEKITANQPKSDTKETDKEDMENQGADKEPATELLEFYVEEDKTKSSPKSEPKSNTTKTQKTATTKTPKPVSKPKVRKKYPKMSFTDNSFAFGVIKPGAVIEHKFEFTNTGSADLVITDAKATCGCTQPSFPFIPIAPGEKGFIGVKYDSTGKLGSQKPTVTLTTNASPKTQKVYLEGLVIGEMSKN